MKKLLFLAITAIFWINSSRAQQCLTTGGCTFGGAQYPGSTFSNPFPNTFTVVATNIDGGEYQLYNVTYGNYYEWSYCSSDGANGVEDMQLTLFNNADGTKLCYSDDICDGTRPKIGWTATFTGTVRVLTNLYNCVTNSTDHTLVWKECVPAAASLGSVSNTGPVNFCDAGGNFTTPITVSGQTGTVVWDWGSNNGVWNNNWITSNSSGVCCFPKKVSNNDGNADRVRYRVITCNGSATSGTILIVNRYNEAPSSLTTPSTSICAGSGNITLTANFPSSINKNGSVVFYSGSCGGTLVGTVTAGDNSSTASITISPPASTTTYYARYEPGTGSGCSNTACAQVTVNVTPNPGFGANTWNVLGYNGNDVNLGAGATYAGYYTEPLLNYASTNRWGTSLSPSNASGWAGCTTVGADNHTVVSKRTGVPSNGVYTVSVPMHDDNYQFYVGGTNVKEAPYCCMVHTDIFTGYMDNTTNLEMRHGEGSGGSNQGLTFTQQNLSATVNKTDMAENVICIGNTGTITFSNPTGAVASPVFRSNFSTAAGVTTYGSASVTSGYLQLTPLAYSQYGAAILANSTACNGSVLRAEFDFRIFDGDGADGFSFNYADMSAGPVNAGENGFGSGLTVSFVTYSGAGGPFVRVSYGGTVISGNYSTGLRDGNFRQCVITVNNSNQLSVSIAGTAVITNLALPGGFQSADKTNWQFSFAGRTGGANDSHRIDNLSINAYNQYEYSIDGASWNNTGLFTGVAPGTHTPRIRNKAFSAYPTSLTPVTINQPAAPNQGTENSHGTNEWYVSCYNSNNHTGYRGFYKTARSSEFNIGSDGMATTGSPDDIVSGTINGAVVTGYSGCSIPSDNWSFKARRQGFTCGIYNIDIVSHDDNVQIRIDADNNGIFEIDNSYPGVGTGAAFLYNVALDANSKVEIWFAELTGDAYLDIDFNAVSSPVSAGSIGGIADGTSICTGGSPGSFTNTSPASGGTPAATNNGGSLTYQWYLNGGAIGGANSATYSPGALTTGTYVYKRRATDKCTSFAETSTITINVVADPVARTITPSPAAGAICESSSVSAIFSGGSGGTGTVTDDYYFSTNSGTSWSTYTPGNSISAAGLAGESIIIRTRRTASGSGCDNSAYNEVTWTVSTTTAIVSATAAASPICPAATTLLTANGVTGTSTTTTWWSGAGGTGTNYGTGPTSLQGPGTYYARVTGTCGNAETSVTVNAKTLTVPASATTATRASGCTGETATLAVSGYTLGTGATINWYTATGGGGTYIGTGASQTHVPASNTTYYARITGDCSTEETNTGLVVVGGVGNVVLATASTEGVESSCDEGAWTYYESSNNAREGKYIFAIRWHGASEKGTETVTISTNGGSPWVQTGTVTVAGVSVPGGTWVMPRYWDVTVGGAHGATLSTPVDIRFYYDPAELAATTAARDAFVAANSGAGTVSEGEVWFKTQGSTGFNPANINASSAVGAEQPSWAITPTFGSSNGIAYAQFNGLTSFSGGTLGAGAGLPGGTPLPIKLTYFKGTKVNGTAAMLEWGTATETNNDYFVIERSADGVTFQQIDIVNGAGSTSTARRYSILDNNPLAGNNYYRLRQVDVDGTSSLSHVVVLNFDKDFSVNIYPNPFSDNFRLDIYTETTSSSNASVEVFDMQGRLVQQLQPNLQSGYNRIDMQLDNLANGPYMIRVVAGEQIVTTSVIKN